MVMEFAWLMVFVDVLLSNVAEIYGIITFLSFCSGHTDGSFCLCPIFSAGLNFMGMAVRHVLPTVR